VRAGIQPSTVGSVFSCLYTIVVNRTFTGFLNYPTGATVLVTVNPSEKQSSGFLPRATPASWNPRVIEVR